jgi:putative transcription antitermination factor YqgF
MFDYLAIDWGTVNIGFAIGSSTTKLVIPSQKKVPTSQLILEINKKIKKYGIKNIVLGFPTNFEGKNTQVSNRILEIKSQLEIEFKDLNIILYNENNTTKLSVDNKTKDKKIKDNLSASKILEFYFNFQKNL